MFKNKEVFRRIYNHKMIEKVEKKIKLLGVNNKMDAIDFINLRIVLSVIFFFMILSISKFGYILAPILTIVFYYLFGYYLLDSKIKKRCQNLESEAIHFFEVLTLSIDAGRNLGDAINVTVSNVNGELALEFKEVMREVKFGKSLSEALRDMEENIPSANINNIILSLTEADIYGNSIINSLYTQIDYLREKRKLEVKAVISKIPIRISVISVLFFVPLILIIILAPIILEYIG